MVATAPARNKYDNISRVGDRFKSVVQSIGNYNVKPWETFIYPILYGWVKVIEMWWILPSMSQPNLHRIYICGVKMKTRDRNWKITLETVDNANHTPTNGPKFISENRTGRRDLIAR